MSSTNSIVGNVGLKSPFEKGGFRGISSAYKNPPYPLYERGVKKPAFPMLPSL
jgi:hypothetical protein